MRLNSKKTKSMVVNRSKTFAPDYGNLTLDDAEFEKLRSLRILGVIYDSKLMFETHFRKVVSKAASSLGVVCRAGKLFDCSRVLKRCFNAYVYSSLNSCAPVWMSSAESHLNLLDSVVRSAAKLCKDELCCLGRRKKVNALCLFYKIYHRVDNSMHKCLYHFVATRNIRISAALGKLALVI